MAHHKEQNYYYHAHYRGTHRQTIQYTIEEMKNESQSIIYFWYTQNKRVKF